MMENPLVPQDLINALADQRNASQNECAKLTAQNIMQAREIDALKKEIAEAKPPAKKKVR